MHMMANSEIFIRKATAADAPFVAMVISEAIGDDIMERYVAAGNAIPEAEKERMKLIQQVVDCSATLYKHIVS